jgi:hypothetical protein
MSYRRLSAIETANFAQAVAHALANHQVSCLSDTVADALAAEIRPVNDDLIFQIKESAIQADILKSINTKKNEREAEIIDLISRVHTIIKGARGSEADFEVCGFSYRKKWTRVVAQEPDQLSVADIGNGINKIKFRGNNPPNRVNYEIFRRQGKSGEWRLLAATPKQSYTDVLENPDPYYEYKVRAKASSSTSGFSNTGAVNTHARMAKSVDKTD